MASRHEQLMQMVNQTQWWSDLNEKQRAKIENFITWSRKTIQTYEGCFWVARIFRRAAIYLSLDPPEDGDTGKWARARKSLDKEGYSMDKAVDEICFLITIRRAPGEGQGTSQLVAVFNNLRTKADKLKELNLDPTKLNPKVMQYLAHGMQAGMGHSEGCPARTGGHCQCGWRDIEARAMELAPMRGPIAIAWGLAHLKYTDEQGRDRRFDEVYKDLNDIGSSLEAIDKLPEGTPVVQLPDKSRWVKLDCHGNEYEAKLMGHCGNMGGNRADTLLSYRVPSNKFPGFFEPKLTFIINPKGELGEMKGEKNQKPNERYHAAIVELLKNKMVKRLTGHGYLPSNNFSLNDLSDELLLELYQARPDLIKEMMQVGDSYQRISGERLKMLTGGQPRQQGSARPLRTQQQEPTDLEGEDHPLPE